MKQSAFSFQRSVFSILAMFLLASCGTYTVQAVPPMTRTPKPTKESAYTSTPVPSPTIGYEASLVVAQQTADEARRVNAIVTSQFEQRIHEQLQMTAQYEQRAQEVYEWTATAALTSIPLTATQQAVNNTQIPMQNQLQAARLTSTHEAPTQMVAMIDAQNYARFGKGVYVSRIVAMIGLAAFLLALTAFFIRFPMPEKVDEDEAEEEPEEKPITRIEVFSDNGAKSHRYTIPISEFQFTELATAITRGIRNFEINAWQRDGVYLRSTKDIQRIRGWVCREQLVTVMPNNELAPKDELLDMLNAWLDGHALPEEYVFKQMPEVGQGMGQDTPSNGKTSPPPLVKFPIEQVELEGKPS